MFKKGDPHDVENYRPISLLSVFSKIIEKIVHSRILNFLNQNNVLIDCQHGFRPGHSTETGTVDFMQYVYRELDEGKYVTAFFFDLTRAFDTIDIDFLSLKIHNLGLRGPINKWIKSFLSNRKIVTKIEESKSDTYDVNIGTPQGSVLGPLLFLLFVNDLPNYITEGKVFMYADDTTIVVSDAQPDIVLYKAKMILDEFNDWCFKNRLIINYSKTSCIEFKNKSTSNNQIMMFNNHEIKIDSAASFLGVILDKNLCWDQHIDKTSSKLNTSFYVISSLRNSLNIETLLKVYYAFVYSTISYNIILWGQASEVSRIFIQQKRIIRIIFNLDYRESCRETFLKYRILTVVSIYLLNLLSYIHINKNNLTRNGYYHNYSTRGRDNIYLCQHKHEYYKKSPIYAGSRIYNSLPDDLKNITSQIIFKNKLKKLLLCRSFYTINEFLAFL